MNSTVRRREVSRRSLLLGGAGFLAVTAAGCNLVGGAGDDPDPSGGGGTSGSGSVTLTAAIVPDPPGASEFYRAQFDLFQEANPGITVEVIENPSDQQLNTLELMFQQGEAPDVFRAQGTQALSRFYDRGWLAPLDDLVTDEFIGRFPEGSLEASTSGLHRDGKLVSIPLVWGDWGYTHVWLYNQDLLAASGFDGPPATWSELEEMATKITADGGGDYFGAAPVAPQYIIDSAAPFSVYVADLQTGRPQRANELVVEGVEMWRRLQANGALMPGWESWDGSRAFTEFAAGRLAMYPSATWHVAEIRKLAPDIKLGIAAHPVPDAGRVGYSARTAAHQPIWSMSSETAHPEESLLLMDFLASVDFYRAYYETFGSFTASQSAWEEQAMENPDQAGILAVAADDIRTVPDPSLLAQGAETFWTDVSGNADLNFTDSIKNAIINDTDYRTIAEGLDTQIQAAIDAAVAENPDFMGLITFPDYDPMQDWKPSA